MKRYVIQAWVYLLLFEFAMRSQDMRTLHRSVRDCSVGPRKSDGGPSSEVLCRAMDYACVLYFKQVLCLQRSSATTLLLRRHGWDAMMVIGVQIIPFKAHAWVEIDGTVVNDKPYIPEIYRVLERS
jgi:Transglutaminase-like superfamily